MITKDEVQNLNKGDLVAGEYRDWIVNGKLHVRANGYWHMPIKTKFRGQWVFAVVSKHNAHRFWAKNS